jgi:hypothetical protein
MSIKVDQESSFTIEKRLAPEFFHKYCSLNEDNREWAKGREIPLKFYQAIKKETEFGLEIIKVIG